MKKNLLFLALFCAFNAWAQTSNGLIAHYVFFGNADDNSGNSQHGVITGAAPASNRLGTPNTAYNFNGTTGSYITIPTANFMVNEYTYSFWGYLNSVPASGGQFIAFSIGGPGGQQQIKAINNNSSGNGWSYTGDNTNSSIYKCTQNSNLVAGQWYHIAVVRSLNKTRLFVEGVVVDDDSTLTNTLPDYGTGTMGKIGISVDGANAFNGRIDDIRIYNRALSGAEILELYLEVPTSINKLTALPALKLFPNPTNGLINIDCSDLSTGIYSVKINNLVGQEVYSSDASLANHDVSTLPKGIYMVMVKDELNAVLRMQRLVIN